MERAFLCQTDQDCHDLSGINRLDEILMPAGNDQVIKMAAITRSTMRRREALTIIQEDVIQQMRLDRIKKAKDEESWIAKLKLYLVGDAAKLGDCCIFAHDRRQTSC